MASHDSDSLGATLAAAFLEDTVTDAVVDSSSTAESGVCSEDLLLELKQEENTVGFD